VFTGDLTIVYDSTRVFGIFFIYCSVCIFALTVSNAVDQFTAGVERGRLRRALQRLATDRFGEKWIRRLLRVREEGSGGGGSGGPIYSLPAREGTEMDGSIESVEKNERKEGAHEGAESACGEERFVLAVLCELGVVSYKRDVAPLVRKFKALDRAGSCRGLLTRADLAVFLAEIQVWCIIHDTLYMIHDAWIMLHIAFRQSQQLLRCIRTMITLVTCL
jgi:hypothetical protein